MVARVLPETSTALPAPATPLLGRERELREITALLAGDDTRIVTLLGPGGVGKTRLALAVAAELESEEPRTAQFVPVAHERDAEGMVAEIAKALAVREQPGATTLESIASALRGAVNLLVVDNLEQIPNAGVELSALVAACPGLTLLATSRAPLRISGERRYRVEPLPIESGDAAESAAARLFVERAKLVGPFDLTAANRATVHAICRRLDGLPLAIELAAARTLALSPEALLARLTSRLMLVGPGPVDLPDRQRTLQAAIAWSYDLLDKPEQRAFRQLATIPAGFGLDLAAAVTGLNEDRALSAIETLLDQSLLTIASGGETEPRFEMLQTIRDFGLGLAAEHGDLESARASLARHFLERGAAAQSGLEGPDAAAWRDWCTGERPNIAAAIDWLVVCRDPNAVVLAGSLWRYWYDGGLYREGLHTLERVLANHDGVGTRELAIAYHGAGNLRLRLDDYAGAERAFGRAVELWEAANDNAGLAYTVNSRAALAHFLGEFTAAIAGYERAIELLGPNGDARRLAMCEDNLGIAYEDVGEHARAVEFHTRAMARSRQIGDDTMTASASRNLATALYSLGEIDSAIAAAEEARSIFERIGMRSKLAYTFNSLGVLLEEKGDTARAQQHYAAALTLWELLEEPRGIALGLNNLGNAALRSGELHIAAERYRRALSIAHDTGNPPALRMSLNSLAGLALAAGDPERAVRLTAYANAYSERHDLPPYQEDIRPKLRRSLGKTRFTAAWNAGAGMDLGEALAEVEMIAVTARAAAAAEPAAPVAAPISAGTSKDHGLTDRELDVLRLVAAGKTNAEIGEALFISPFTAKTHVANLLGKLGVESRAAASTWAAQHGLL